MRERTFTLNDDVFVKNFASAGPNWLSGKIIAIKGPVSYDIQLKDGKVVHRHLDHIRTGIPMPEGEVEDDSVDITLPITLPVGLPLDEPENVTDSILVMRTHCHCGDHNELPDPLSVILINQLKGKEVW